MAEGVAGQFLGMGRVRNGFNGEGSSRDFQYRTNCEG